MKLCIVQSLLEIDRIVHPRERYGGREVLITTSHYYSILYVPFSHNLKTDKKNVRRKKVRNAVKKSYNLQVFPRSSDLPFPRLLSNIDEKVGVLRESFLPIDMGSRRC